MNPLEIVVVCLFLGLLVGTGYRIVAMWEKKKAGEPSGRARLVFFFVACLMLVCLVPLAVFEMLTIPVGASDLMVVVGNMIGFALTYDLALSRGLGGKREGQEQAGVRVYTVYYRGSPYGIITKEGFDLLLGQGLLMRQRTVELVEDFKQKAREQGLGIRLLKKRDGSQTLIKVETISS